MRLAVCVALVTGLATIVWQALQITGSAALYPIMVAGGALLCSGALLISHVTGAPDSADVPAVPRLSGLQWVRLFVFAFVWVAYVILLPRFGFILTTWIALSLSLAVTRGRPEVATVVATAGFVLLFAVLIKGVLYVPVPQGWIDTQLEIHLYRIF